ncbi:MAG: hypothetical protein LBD21_06660 [Tannerellaceae bacterium]|nr:hypothetical protein [Tannerellaceae bacterium]
MYRKHLSLLLIGGLSLLPGLITAQIGNVRVAAEENRIIITYDYVEQSEAIDDIAVTYTSGSDTTAKKATALSGDIRDLRPGTDKRIVWSPLEETPVPSSENLVIKLTGLRDPAKQELCDDKLHLADNYFRMEDNDNAIHYYKEMLNCPGCNCHPKDIAYALAQIERAEARMNQKDKLHLSYLFDMATADGGGSLQGVSVFQLRAKGVGYYASFRSNGAFYSPQRTASYYNHKDHADNYIIEPLGTTRISSWLFSTGITRRFWHHEYASAYAYGGIGIGANATAGEHHVTEAGYTGKQWITNERQNLFLSPELGVMANVVDWISLMAGIKLPIALTDHDIVKPKGISFMLGAGIKLKNLDADTYGRRANTYVAYILDLPDQSGPDKLQSTNIIGISAGTLSYNKVGGYFSARINPLVFNSREESDLGEGAVYRGMTDYGNAFATVGLTWMYFYGGVGVSYQKEFKAYREDGADIWNSSRTKFGACTEFGINLRLFDKLLLRGGVTFPGFNLSGADGVFTMGPNNIYYSLGIGYVLPSRY